jgi:hypothetical protein
MLDITLALLQIPRTITGVALCNLSASHAKEGAVAPRARDLSSAAEPVKLSSDVIPRMNAIAYTGEERRLRRVSKDDVQFGACGHPSRLARARTSRVNAIAFILGMTSK